MCNSIASRLIEKYKTAQAILEAISYTDQESGVTTWGAALIGNQPLLRCVQFHFQDGSRINFFDNGKFTIVE
jgi:hypothetical protein